MSDRVGQKRGPVWLPSPVMQDEPSPDKSTPPAPNVAAPGSGAGATEDRREGDRGSDAEVVGDNNALDLVDQALEALDHDDLELAEELAEQLQDREPSNEG